MRPLERIQVGLALLFAALALMLRGGGVLPVIPSTPLAAKGVLVVEEKQDRGNLPASQLAALDSAELRELVTAAGGEWRHVDRDQTLESGPWADAFARERTTLPWWIVSDGRRGEEGPMPETTAAAREVLGKYFAAGD